MAYNKILVTILILSLPSYAPAMGVSWTSGIPLTKSERQERFRYWLDRSLTAVHIFISSQSSDPTNRPIHSAIREQMQVSKFWTAHVAMPSGGADLELIMNVREHVVEGKTHVDFLSLGTFTKGHEVEVIQASEGCIPLRGDTSSPVILSMTFNKKNLGELASLLIIPIPASGGLQGDFEYMDPTNEKWHVIPGFHWEVLSESAYQAKLKSMQDLSG